MKKSMFIALACGALLAGVASCESGVVTIPTNVVTFNTQGGSAVASQNVPEGGHATRPANPTRAGYEFAGWYHEANSNRAWDFANVAIFSNVTIYAGWTGNGATADVSALRATIAGAEAMVKTHFSANSWTFMQAALATAKTVAANASATQAEVNKAQTDLQTAIDALVYLAELNALITTAEGANRSDYDESGWTTLQNVLSDSKTIRDKPNVTKDEISREMSDIQTALANRINQKSTLQDAVRAAKLLPEGAYTPESYAPLRTAITNAEAVIANDGATPQQIDDAMKAMSDATKGLVLKPTDQSTAANKTALNTSIANAESKVQSEYTSDSWGNMQTALADAKKVQADAAASQAQADAAAANLDRYVAALQHTATSSTTPTGSVDKSALNSFIADSEKLKQADYTADSWTVFQNALTRAKEVSADSAATQQQTDTAYTNLETSVNNLALAQTDTGVVSGLVNQLTSLVNSLPNTAAIESNPLLGAVVTPVARLADAVRDQLMPLVGGTNAEVNALGSQLNGILTSLNLGDLI